MSVSILESIRAMRLALNRLEREVVAAHPSLERPWLDDLERVCEACAETHTDGQRYVSLPGLAERWEELTGYPSPSLIALGRALTTRCRHSRIAGRGRPRVYWLPLACPVCGGERRLPGTGGAPCTACVPSESIRVMRDGKAVWDAPPVTAETLSRMSD